MNCNTELVLILDRSGSMAGLEADTIGGFNSMLAKQKKLGGVCRVTTVLFDDRYELLHDRMPLTAVSEMTDREYYVRGSTALLDAIGSTVGRITEEQLRCVQQERADRILFVIITDGLENSSREYSAQQIRKLIHTRQQTDGWEFLFLGANIDAIAAAAQYGIRRDHAVNYHADAAGTKLNYEVLNKVVTCVRSREVLPANWKNPIETDFTARCTEK